MYPCTENASEHGFWRHVLVGQFSSSRLLIVILTILESPDRELSSLVRYGRIPTDHIRSSECSSESRLGGQLARSGLISELVLEFSTIWGVGQVQTTPNDLLGEIRLKPSVLTSPLCHWDWGKIQPTTDNPAKTR